MLNTDARASALITFINDLDDDQRIPANERSFLTTYRSKLASAPTTLGEDVKAAWVFLKFLQAIGSA